MKRWNLYQYADRFSIEGPSIVETFEIENDEFTPILEATEGLKLKNPRALPLIIRQPSRSNILHIVRKSGEYDVVCDSIEMAHSWVEFRLFTTREPGNPYSVESIWQDKFPDWVRTAPQIKSIWEWLRNPAF
jgi:hypothetical protein